MSAAITKGPEGADKCTDPTLKLDVGTDPTLLAARRLPWQMLPLLPAMFRLSHSQPGKLLLSLCMKESPLHTFPGGPGLSISGWSSLPTVLPCFFRKRTQSIVQARCLTAL